MLFSLRRLALLAALTAFAFSFPAFAEGPLRGKVRDRVKERIAEKIQDMPAPVANASVADKITRPGDYIFSIPHEGLTRFYIVHVPRGFRGQEPAPLLFAFHGGGGDMEYMAKDEYYGLISKSDKEGFILVIPNGYSNLKSGKFATWNAGACCGDARDKKIDDIGFVKAIVDNLSSQMRIDQRRIFATGMSNGGMMAYRIACELPDIFSAIASVTGTDNTLQCNPSNPVSVLHIHARDDTHVLFNGGAGKDAFNDITKVTDFVSVPDTVALWVKRNACNPAAKRVLEVPGAYCDLYSGCTSGTEVKLCVTETGGHSWPGGYKPRGGPTSQAISANDVLWEFFMNNPRRDEP